jgi:hypothetical protein
MRVTFFPWFLLEMWRILHLTRIIHEPRLPQMQGAGRPAQAGSFFMNNAG